MLEIYKKLLSELIKFKSVSTDPTAKGEMAAAGQWLKKIFEAKGFKVNILEGYGNPVIVASLVVDPIFKTCLIYGHYDVQPASLEEGWLSEPFELNERDGRIYGRGATDNKGQFLIHVASIFDLLEKKQLGYNIKFMLEGDEETGSPFLEKLITDNQELLAADLAMVSDGEVVGDWPVIETGFRGGFNSTLMIRTAAMDLHSGLYGGAAPSAAHVLAKFVANLFNDKNEVVVPGFYDGVDAIDAATVANNKTLPFDQAEYEKITGCKTLLMELGMNFYSQTGLRPTIQATTLVSGYLGDGYRNGIPATASVKLNFRLVKSQDPLKVAELFRNYLKTALPTYAEYDFQVKDPYEGIKLNTENEYVKKAVAVWETVAGKKPLFKYVGGGLPIVTLFNDVLKVAQVVTPLANEDCAMHAVQENIKIANVERGLAFSQKFFGR